MPKRPDENEFEEDDNVLVSVIIVNYNGKHFLDECLQSLIDNLSCSHEIIVVDNDSHDGSVSHLSQQWPEVRLVPSADNLGFARGNNLGAEIAKGEYLLLLNNDTKVLEPVLPLITYLEEHRETAVVGGRLRFPDGSIQPSIGFDHTPARLILSWMLPRTSSWLNTWQISDKRSEIYHGHRPDVHWVSGAYLCVRHSVWKNVNGFDREIFMYVEDVDLCRRIRREGLGVAFYAGADVCHFEGGGKKGMSGHALFATIDSYRLLLKKQYGGVVRLCTCALLSLVFVIRAGLYLLSSIVKGDALNATKARFFLQGAGRLLWERAKLNPPSSVSGSSE